MPWPRRSLESVLKRRVDRTPVELIEHHDYQYKPLKQGGEETVRVFVLFPAASRGDPLVCHLIERALDKFCHEALSYVWGGSNHKRPIYCADHGQNQGGRLEITQNLDEALRAIRTKRSVRSIWVDALCINQQDADERIRQIPLMEDRFIQGPREHSSGWAKVTNILLDYLGSTGGTVILGECPEKHGRNIRKAHSALKSHPWFYRLWNPPGEPSEFKPVNSLWNILNSMDLYV